MVKNMAWSHLSPQQINSIKNSAKGAVPSFISGGVYNKDGITSIGGRIGNKPDLIGGTIGYDKKAKKAFGSINVRGKVKGSFGPQE